VLFTTVGFAAFLALVFLGAWLLRPWPEHWKAFLLLASVVFFGWWDWRLCLVLAGVIVVAQVAAIGVHRAHGRSATPWVAGSAAVLLGAFVMVARVGIDGLDGRVVVPLGMALLVLRAISYVVDVRRGILEPAPIVDAALALSFFPGVVAGPLVRPAQLLRQLHVQPVATAGAGGTEPIGVRRIPAARAFRLLVVGLFWLWVIAPFLGAELVDPVFGDPSAHSALEVLAAAYGFTVQLFAYLAGYASMAIGVGLLLGFRLPENFQAPLVTTSLRRFWRAWTVTFSLWLRDYLYLPLGGSRADAVLARNLVLTLLAAGLLFVGGWNGLVWGLLMGAALAVERSVTGGRRGGFVGWLVTFHVVVLGWVIVRAGELSVAGELLARLGSWGDAPLVTPLVVAVIAGAVVVQLVPRHVPHVVDVVVSRLPVAVQAVGLALALLLVDALGQGTLASTAGAAF
jgi:D-alanyl-lipoteichoic acid acyltransferase DltB (MBOAT superfamily)